MHELTIARRAALAGGEVLASHFRQDVTLAQGKGKSYDLVSAADRQAEQVVVEVIRQAFPGHDVLGEESHDAGVDAEHLWIVDPLDGTTNFVHRVPHFAVSVAYYRGGEPACGVVYNPIRQERYEAVRGGGAELNDQPLRVANHANLTESLIGVGFYYDRGAMMESTLAAIRDLFQAHIHGIRRFGTASLDLAQVAAGAFGAYFEFELSPWDFAAGRLLVEEAGGRVTTCSGDALPLARTSLLASNRVLHEAVLQITQRHVPILSP